jgi:sterol desaturase/sphingolipid hydroxylase (fatty acid hydroxylase superfamily)
MWAQWLLAGALAFVIAFLVGTLVEYVVHRLMHKGSFLGRVHAQHHKSGVAQGVVGEFKDYLVGTTPILAAGFLVSLFGIDSVAAGVGFVAGGLVYAALAAYAHQVQHERPELVFWLSRPVHHLHHKHHMWRHNFGILVDFWDRVFGTYQLVEWQPQRRPFQHPLREFFRIKWL